MYIESNYTLPLLAKCFYPECPVKTQNALEADDGVLSREQRSESTVDPILQWNQVWLNVADLLLNSHCLLV